MSDSFDNYSYIEVENTDQTRGTKISIYAPLPPTTMNIGSNGLRYITNSERRFSNYRKEVDDIKVDEPYEHKVRCIQPECTHLLTTKTNVWEFPNSMHWWKLQDGLYIWYNPISTPQSFATNQVLSTQTMPVSNTTDVVLTPRAHQDEVSKKHASIKCIDNASLSHVGRLNREFSSETETNTKHQYIQRRR
jgi:hypothetical protein